MLRTFILTLSAGFVLFVAAGCGVEDTWVLCDPRPVAVRSYYTFNKVTFYKDKGFQAELSLGDHKIKAAGTYEYNSCKEKLTLRTGGREFVYKVRVPGNDTLLFKKQVENEAPLTMTLVRHYRCPDCATCGPCNMMYRKYRPGPDEDFSRPLVGQVNAPSMSSPACSCAGS